MTTLQGTPNFLAPEVISGQPYTSQVDLFSVGCLAYTLAVGSEPFSSATSFSDIFARISRAQWSFPDSPSLPASFRNLVTELLATDPAVRPTAEVALRHPFLARPGIGGRKPSG